MEYIIAYGNLGEFFFLLPSQINESHVVREGGELKSNFNFCVQFMCFTFDLFVLFLRNKI